MAEIEVTKLHKRFGDFIAVIESDFTINDGEFFVILGPSGCGKTTTLRMIAGLELPASGQILLDGTDVSFERASNRDIAFMFQMYALYPHMNVQENICFPLKCQGYSKKDIKTKLAEVARILKIEHILTRKVSSLAGGDRQRVALGRAIIREPKAFLMDEPLGALDSEFRHDMTIELRELHNRMNATTVYVTHDQMEAMMLADRIMVMNHGVIEQIGTPDEIYNKPRSMFVAEFVGEPAMNLLQIDDAVSQGDENISLCGRSIKIPKINANTAGNSYCLGVRPDQFVLGDESSGLKGNVVATEYFGTNQVVTLQTDIGTLKARVSTKQTFELDTSIPFSLLPDKLIVFDKQSGKALDSDFMRLGV